MNEDQILEFTYRSPSKLQMTNQEKLDAIRKLKLEVMAKNSTGLFVSIDPETFNPRKGVMTKYGKKLIEEGGKYYKSNLSNMGVK